MKRLSNALPATGVFCLALLVRVAYNLIVARNYVPKYDAALYHYIARHLVLTHCFCLYGQQPTVSRAPLWPLIMALIYTVTGPHDVFARLFYAVLGSGTCLLVYFFARDLFGRRVALWTGLIAALYTGLFIYDGWLYAESLYTFLLTALAYTLYRFQRTGQRRWIVGGGIALGLAALTRPNGPILFALVLFWAILMLRDGPLPRHTLLRGSLLILLLGAALLAPWTYRNYRVTHALLPVALGEGDVLLGAYNDTVLTSDPNGRGLWVPRSRIAPPLPPNMRLGHDLPGYSLQNERQDTDYALHWIGSHLSLLPTLFVLHLVNMWTPYTFEPGLPVREFPHAPGAALVWSLMHITPIPIFLLAAAGLCLTWRRRRSLTVVYLILALTIAQNVLFYGNIRFRAPIEPLLVLLAGGTLWWLTAREPGTLSARLRTRDRQNIRIQVASDT